MNLRYQEQAIEQLRKLAKEDKPFLLQYWPLYPLTGPRTTTDEYTAPNGGNYVEKMKLVDHLFRDPQEKYPLSTEIGAWGGAKFVRMIQRHMARKDKYPSDGPATGIPYDGIDNLGPESKAAVQEFLFMMKTPQM
jgi:arylsulfatase